MDSPARDARRLLDLVLGGAGAATRAGPDHVPDAATAARFAAFIERRAAGEPVARIAGRRAFWGRDFAITPAVLDPRPETETLIAEALAEPFARVIDLGTGSGAILCTLLAERPQATGTGTDISADALAVARANAQALGVAERAEFLRADWWQGVGGVFDLVVSNPPYIAAAELAGLATEVVAHEPPQALSPGRTGLEAYRAIAAGLAAHLAPGGRALFEIGPSQGAAVAEIFRQAGFGEIRILPDLDGRDRVVALRKSRA